MHERIFILAMRAGATVMLEAMNIQIWKQTTITLHICAFLAQPRWFAIIRIDASMPPSLTAQKPQPKPIT